MKKILRTTIVVLLIGLVLASNWHIIDWQWWVWAIGLGLFYLVLEN